jgi:pimeloyl-ACP methyl ester carboxylesterase
MIDGSKLWKNLEAYEAMQALYSSELARLTVPYESHYIDTRRHGKTHVLTAGNPANPALVFWHGMNAFAASWVNEINVFAAEYYVIAPDCVGDTGRSEPNRLKRKTMQHGEWAADVLQALDISQAHHIGISGGGWMIIKLANVAPQTILSAMLVSTGGFINVNMMILFKMLPAMLITPPDKLAYRFVKMMGVPGREPSPEELRMFELIFHFKSENGVPALPDEQIRALKAPTAILMGEHEQAFKPPRKVLERAKRLLPNLIHAEIVQGVGHGMNGENPSLFERKVRDFLAQVTLQTAKMKANG